MPPLSTVWEEPLEDAIAAAAAAFEDAHGASGDAFAVGELDWFASDNLGQVAIITSFYVAGAPAAVFRSKEDFVELHRCVHSLPRRSAPRPAPGASGKLDAWLAYSHVGLYGYSSGVGSSRSPVLHRAQTQPTEALLVGELPEGAGRTLRRLRFDARFDVALVLDTRSLGPLLPTLALPR